MKVLMHFMMIPCVALLVSFNLSKSNTVQKTVTSASTGVLFVSEGPFGGGGIYSAELGGVTTNEIVWEVSGGIVVSGQGTYQMRFMTAINNFTIPNLISITVRYRDLATGEFFAQSVSRAVLPGLGFQ